jgi:threonine synthase
MSTHADRLEVIREAYEGTGTVVDPHTADGLKVAREYLEPGVSMLVLETAKPQKFAETVREAIGRDPEVSAELADLLERPQRVVEMSDDADQLREYIREHAVRG